MGARELCFICIAQYESVQAGDALVGKPAFMLHHILQPIKTKRSSHLLPPREQRNLKKSLCLFLRKAFPIEHLFLPLSDVRQLLPLRASVGLGTRAHLLSPDLRKQFIDIRQTCSEKDRFPGWTFAQRISKCRLLSFPPCLGQPKCNSCQVVPAPLSEICVMVMLT